MTSELFFEIGTEELPAHFVRQGLSHLEFAMRTALADHHRFDLTGVAFATFGTPRRMALSVRNLPTQQADSVEEALGPPVSAAYDREGVPTKAAVGFAAGKGVELSKLKRKQTPKGEYLCAVIERRGKALRELLPATMADVLTKMPQPKSMRWGSGEHAFVRPVHWIVAVLDGEVLPLTFAGIAAGSTSVGHRIMSPKTFSVSDLVSYLSGCRRNKVVPHEVVDPRLDDLKGFSFGKFPGRREIIERGLHELAEERQAQVFGHAVSAEAGIDQLMCDTYYGALLDEVVELVEFPVPIAGRFDEEFLKLPREVILSELREHQRCFGLVTPQGKLLPEFVAIADNGHADEATVRAGNERVIRARLSDAAFFYKTDREQPLPSRVDALKGIIFQRQLGTLYEKMDRVTRLALYMGHKLAVCDPLATGETADTFLARPLPTSASREARVKWLVGRAAMLAKADLVSNMVGEFPELQGIMGRDYARAGNEPDEIAFAIEDHYRPRFAGDSLPRSRVGDLIALADKLDTICGIIGIGKLPSGSADPFGLRRAAIGVLRLAIEHDLQLDLREVVGYALSLLREKLFPATPAANASVASETAAAKPGAKAADLPVDPAARLETLTREVLDFLVERMRNSSFGEGTHPTEVVSAVLSARFDVPLDAHYRIAALTEVYQSPEFVSVTTTFKRVINILKEGAPAGEVERNQFKSDEESRLFAATSMLQKQLGERLTHRSTQAYKAVLADLAAFRPTVDTFFEKVLINAEEPALRQNRQRLVRDVGRLFRNIADFSKLHVK